MPVIDSAIELRSRESGANAEAMRRLVADLNETVDRVRLGGGKPRASSIFRGENCCRAIASAR